MSTNHNIPENSENEVRVSGVLHLFAGYDSNLTEPIKWGDFSLHRRSLTVEILSSTNSSLFIWQHCCTVDRVMAPLLSAKST
jgi:hypothetical protein